MKPKSRSIIIVLVSLLFAVNTLYAMEMKADFKMHQKGQTEQSVEQKKNCHGDPHGESVSMGDYSYDCCGVDCQSCTSMSLFQGACLINSFDAAPLLVVLASPSSPKDAHASNLFRPPIFS